MSSSARQPFNTGWSYRTKVTAFQELGGADGALWTDVTLPHDAMIHSDRTPEMKGGETSGYFPGGAFEYKRTLAIPAEDAGKYIALEFDGVYRDAVVYVNGALAGQWAFGYSRFVVRIDPFLNFGADNEIRVACRAHLDSRWYTGAGIYRDVHLVVKSPVRIAVDGVRVTTPDVDADRAVVGIEVLIENGGATSATAVLTTIVENPAGDEVARGRAPITLLPGEADRARTRLYVSAPELWDVESPSLYRVRTELAIGEEIVDVERVPLGIRTLKLDPQHGLRINGRSVKLRGACIHGDNGPLGAAAIARAEERKIELLKAAGFNAIRSSHHPASPALLDACDRLGMLVMDETFDVWTSAKSDFDYSFDFPEWWERDVEALVAKDFHHPSVIFYSIGNEIPETGDRFGSRWGRLLAEKLRSLDPTRYITNGVNGFVSSLDLVLKGRAQRAQAPAQGGVNEMMAGFGAMMDQIQASPMVTSRTEESFAVLDVAGLNYGTARYELDRTAFPNRIIVGTETWPDTIDRNWALVTANPHLLGDFTWTGFDYLGENGIGVVKYVDDTTGDGSTSSSFATAYPGLTAFSGDIDIVGHRRPVSYYRETVFGLRSEPYIAVHRPQRYDATVLVSTPWSWSDSVASWSWAGFEGQPIRAEVYSDAEEIVLQLDGEEIGRAVVGENKAFRADFNVTYQPGELVAIALADGVETGRASLTSARGDRQLVVSSDRSHLMNTTDDLAYLEIILTDGDGALHGTESPITVQVTGAGVLQALGSGNPVSADRFDSSTHSTFDGRAVAIVRPTGDGEITVTATADGCAPVELTLTVA